MAALTQILESSLKKQKEALGTIKTDSYKIYEMGNSKKWFKTVTFKLETRKWLEESMADGEDIYLVVGYFTVKHAHVEQQSAITRSTKIKAQVPVGQIVGASTGLNPGDTTNIGVLADQNQSSGVEVKFDALDEQICSV